MPNLSLFYYTLAGGTHQLRNTGNPADRVIGDIDDVRFFTTARSASQLCTDAARATCATP